MRLTAAAVAGLVFACLLSPTAAKADPVNLQNGGFEHTSLSSSSQVGDQYGGQAVQNWTATGYTFLYMPGEADTTGAMNQFGQSMQLWGAGNGSNNGLGVSPVLGNYLALDGDFEAGTVSQDLSGLIIGNYVTVSFYFAGAQQYNFDGNTQEWFDVQLGNDVQSTQVLQNANHGFTGWQQQQLTFLATSTTETLKFLAHGTPTGEPPFVLLDGVSADQGPTPPAAPEPGSLLLLGTGVLGMAAMARRRFSR